MEILVSVELSDAKVQTINQYYGIGKFQGGLAFGKSSQAHHADRPFA